MRSRRFYTILRMAALGVAISRRLFTKPNRGVSTLKYDNEVLGI